MSSDERRAGSEGDTAPDPEQDWDRNISASLAGLARRRRRDVPVLEASEDELPELEKTRELPRVERSPPPSAGRRRLLLVVLAAIGVALLTYAAWPWLAGTELTTTADSGGAPRSVDLPRRTPTDVGADSGTDSGTDSNTPAAADAPGSAAAGDALREAVRRSEARVAELEDALTAEQARGETARARVAELEAELASLAERLEAAEAAEAAGSGTATAASAPDRVAPRREATGAAPIADGAWTVSLMTLSSRGAAERYEREVTGKGWPAEVQEVGTGGGLFRVQSGAFDGRAEAEAHARTLREALGLEGLWVTRRVREAP